MGKPKDTRGTIVAVVAIALLFATLGGVFWPEVLELILPGAGGVAASSPPGDVRGPGADPQVLGAQLDALIAQADEAQKLNDWESCLEALEEAASIAPANAALRERLYQAHVSRGWQLTSDHRLEQAKAEFTSALGVSPHAAEAQEGLRLLEQLVVTGAGGGPLPTVLPVPTFPPEIPTPMPPTPQPVVVSAPQAVVAVPQQAVVCPQQQVVVCPQQQVVVCPTVVVCPPVVVCPTVVVCPPVCVPVCPSPCPVTSCQRVVSAVVPEVNVRIHVVERGETLFVLAAQFNTTVAAIMKTNGLTSATLRVGQKIAIP